jgi:hypothetical protein
MTPITLDGRDIEMLDGLQIIIGRRLGLFRPMMRCDTPHARPHGHHAPTDAGYRPSAARALPRPRHAARQPAHCRHRRDRNIDYAFT